MVVMPQTLVKNKFLDCLSGENYRLLLPHLKNVYLSESDTLYEQCDIIEHVYFPLNCVISTVVIMNDGATVEVCMTGRENVAGIAAIFGEYRARHWTRVLIPGEALRIKAQTLRELFRKHETLQGNLMDCYGRGILQISQRAVCNSRHTITQRTCCWLLMVHDRVGADDLPLTHDLIAGRIGVRRAGITQAASMLQSMGAIRYNRGNIHIADRTLIEQAACECYLSYKSEFEWLENYAAEKPPRLKKSMTRKALRRGPQSQDGSNLRT